MNIDWNHVTRFSQLIAIALFVGVFALGFLLGQKYEDHAFANAGKPVEAHSGDSKNAVIPADVVFDCDGGKYVEAVFFDRKALVVTSDKRSFELPQTVSGSGARYATPDESIVFWNKGNTAFMTEGKETTFANCVQRPD